MASSYTDSRGVTHTGGVYGNAADNGWGDQNQYTPDFTGMPRDRKDQGRLGGGYWGTDDPDMIDVSLGYTNPTTNYSTGVQPGSLRPDNFLPDAAISVPNSSMVGTPQPTTQPPSSSTVDPYGFGTNFNAGTMAPFGNLGVPGVVTGPVFDSVMPNGTLPSTAPLPPARPTDVYPSITPRTTVPQSLPSVTRPSVGVGGQGDSVSLSTGNMGAFMDAMTNPSFASSYSPTKDYTGYTSPGYADSSINVNGKVSTTGVQSPSTGFSPSIGGIIGGLGGLAVGGPLGAIAGYGLGSGLQTGLTGLSGLLGDGGGGYQGSGMAGDTYSNSKGFSDPGGWSLGNLDSGLLGGLMDGSAYGGGNGGGGGFQDGGGFTGEMGGYGNADGSPSNNNPGIW